MTVTLTDYVQNSTGFAESTTSAVVNSVIAFLSTSLRNGEEVRIEGLGIFKIVDKPEREGRNPRTGKPTIFKASRKPKLAFSKPFIAGIQPDPTVQPVIEPVVEPVVEVKTASAKVAKTQSPPPIPANLGGESVLNWQIKAPDGSFIEVPSSELAGWGVSATTPVYSPATGWKLAGNIPELAGIV